MPSSKDLFLLNRVDKEIQRRSIVELSILYYYWHEVAGPLAYYEIGAFTIEDEDIFLLLSSNERYSVSEESSFLGPYYLQNHVIIAYNRSVTYPEATDERLRLLGTDCWIMLACKKENEVILLGNLEIVKLILDMEFDSLIDVNQLTTELAEKLSKAILKVYG